MRLAGKSDKAKYCGDVLVPVMDCRKNQQDECRMKHRACSVGLSLEEDEISDYGAEELFAATPSGYKPCDWCRTRSCHAKYVGAHWYKKQHIKAPLDWREALRNGKTFSRRLANRHFKLECYPNNTLTTTMIRARMEMWRHYEGWVPDVVVIDYADILAPSDRRVEFRHQENEKWKDLRAISQECHCLVIVPTQANAASYEASTLKMKHFSEDKRKFAHVTGMIGLNQSPVEKRRGIMRLNWLVLREDDFEVTKTVKVMQSIRTGRPCLGSYF